LLDLPGKVYLKKINKEWLPVSKKAKITASLPTANPGLSHEVNAPWTMYHDAIYKPQARGI
jgi:hypothetical protein